MTANVPDGFRLHETTAAGAAVVERLHSPASTQFKPGDLLTFANGVAAKAAATDEATHIYNNLITPESTPQMATADLTTALQEDILATRISNGQCVVRSGLVGNSAPTFDGTACNSNTDLSTVKFTGAGSTNDFVNGQVYIPEIGQQRLVTADVVAGGVHTLTVDKAFRRAPTTGDTLRIVPFSKGCNNVKLNATTPHRGISTAVADKANGKTRIYGVDLANYLVYCTFKAQDQ